MATDKTRYKDVKVRIPEEELAVLNCRVAKTGVQRTIYPLPDCRYDSC